MTALSDYHAQEGDFGSRRGIALLLVLLVVLLLSASVIAFIRDTRLEAVMAENTYAYHQAEILAQAGLEGAMALLAMDDNGFDALTDEWANFPRYAALAGGFLENGQFLGAIEDLSSRFNPNRMFNSQGVLIAKRAAMFERLLDRYAVDRQLAPALLDWIDRDDEVRAGGAEDPYYLSLDQPYPCANGDLADLDRITLVKGFAVAEVPGTAERPGLVQSLTVHSDGKINVNTAPEAVLASLDERITIDLAREIIRHRTAQPFEKLGDLRQVPGLDPEIFSAITDLITVSSGYFLIRVEGRFREARVFLTVPVERTGGGVKILAYKAH